MAQTSSDKAAAASGQAGGGAAGGHLPEDKSPNSNSDPIAMLKADHRQVEQLFTEFEKANDNQRKKQLAQQICTALVVHTMIEEEIFYPACQGHMEKRLLDEAQVEHDGAKALIIEIQTGSPSDEYYDAKVKVLSEDIRHHVGEEEKPREGILAKAKESGVATPELAQRLAARKHQLMNEAQAGALDRPQTHSFGVGSNGGGRSPSKEYPMARGSSATMERDERGRFVSDDDDYRRRGRSRYDDDDDDRRTMRARDEEGRFTSRRSRYDGDDDRRGGRGHGGWFGDPEGHSEASREGWEGRRGSSRSRYDDDDDRRYSRDRGQRGWFGDPEGHSEASREGWEGRRGGSRSRSRYDDDDDDRGYSRDRGQSGWFGDPRGHAEAAREGWEGRRSGSRSRYDDDDDSRRDGRGHGGWYGDPRGHAEAAREGWEGRSDTRTRSRSRYDDDDDDDRRGGRGHGGWYGDPEGHSEAARQRRR
jgi:hypothetical protein